MSSFPDAAAAALDAMLTYEYICKLEDIPEGGRRCFMLPSSQRSVLLFRIKGSIFCIDQTCYHHGGPLLNGDIEELGGKTTIKCPWHAYHIAIETGEGLYMGVDMAYGPNGKMQATAPRVKSKGVKQRTHFVQIRDDEDVYVADSSRIPDCSTIESDTYAFRHIIVHSPTNADPLGRVRLHSRFE